MGGSRLFLQLMGTPWCAGWLLVLVAATVWGEPKVHQTSREVGTWMATRHMYIQEEPLVVEKNETVFWECPPGCGRHGRCDFLQKLCVCQPGFHGVNCTAPNVCPQHCNKRGICIRDGECICADGFEGASCEIDARCPSVCRAHGRCINAGTECECAEGFTGELCEERKKFSFKPRTWKRVFPPEKRTIQGIKPEARFSHSAVAIGDENSGKMLLWGGNTATATLNDMWIYDMSSASWHKQLVLGEVPRPRSGFASTSSHTDLYVFGGFLPCEEAKDPFTNELWKFNFDSQTWLLIPNTLASTLSEAPVGRSGHTLTTLNGKLVAFGGGGKDETFGDTWTFSLKSLRWDSVVAAPFGSLRFHTATAVSGTQSLLVFGGLNTNGEAQKALHQFDVEHQAWKELPSDGPEPRYHHAALFRETSLYVFGGRNSDSEAFFSDIWQFSMETSAWTELEPTGTVPGLVGASFLHLGNSAVIFGGLALDFTSASIHHFEFPTKTWSNRVSSGNLPRPRMLTSGNVIGKTLWVFGGQSAEGAKYNDLWDFDLVHHEWTMHFPTIDSSSFSGATYTCQAKSNPEIEWPSVRSSHAAAVETSSPSTSETHLCGSTPGLVIYGGLSATEEVLNEVWYFCPSTSQFTQVKTNPQSNTPPPLRTSAAIIVHEKRLLIFGGLTAARKRMNDLWECDLTAGSCVEVESTGNKHPHPRRSMSFHLDPRMSPPQYLVYGGYWTKSNPCPTCPGTTGRGQGETDLTTDTWRFETQYRRWRKLAANDNPPPRHCPGSMLLSEYMFTFGGLSVDGATELDDMWAFNLDFGQWHSFPRSEVVPPPRHEFVFDKFALPKRELHTSHAVVYGGIGQGGLLNDVWVTELTDVLGSDSHKAPYPEDKTPPSLATQRSTNTAVHTHSSRARMY